MHTNRDSIATIVIATATTIIIPLIQYQVKAMPDCVIFIVYTVCGLAIIGAILSLTPIWDRWFPIWSKWFPKRTSVITELSTNLPRHDNSMKWYENIVDVNEPAPNRRPSMISNIFFTIFNTLVIGYGLFVIYIMIIAFMANQFNWTWAIAPILLLAPPIWNLVDYFVKARRRYKLGKSSREKHKTIIWRGELDRIFTVCLKVIYCRTEKKINSRVFRVKRPELIRILFGSCILTVMIRQLVNDEVRIYFQSDNQYVTDSLDFGKNQRNVDELDRLFREELIYLQSK